MAGTRKIAVPDFRVPALPGGARGSFGTPNDTEPVNNGPWEPCLLHDPNPLHCAAPATRSLRYRWRRASVLGAP